MYMGRTIVFWMSLGMEATYPMNVPLISSRIMANSLGASIQIDHFKQGLPYGNLSVWSLVTRSQLLNYKKISNVLEPRYED